MGVSSLPLLGDFIRMAAGANLLPNILVCRIHQQG